MDAIDYLELYGFEELSGEIDDLFPEWGISFEEMVGKLLHGEGTEVLFELFGQIQNAFLAQIESFRTLAVLLLVLGILGSFYQVFAAAFKDHQITDAGYYIFYLALVGILIKSYFGMQRMAMEWIDEMLLFMKLMIPTFCMCVGISNGNCTASSTYTIAAFLMFVVERIVPLVLFPLLSVYAVLALLNELWEEERLGPLLDQMKSLLQFLVKVLLYSVFGITLIRNAISPVIDQFTGSVLQKVVGGLPGIGNAAMLAWQTTMGAALLIKNSVGVVFVMLLIMGSLVPVCNVAAFAVIIKLDTVLLGMLQDNRIVHCMQRLGDSGMLLLRILLGAIGVFVVFIALTVMMTGTG